MSSHSVSAGTTPRVPLILVVDDEFDLRQMVRRLLERKGYRVLEASGGEHALALASECLPEIDLLLTDVRMPGMNGHELARRLTRLRPDLRVVFISGYNDVDLGPEAELVPKPFNPEALQRLIERKLAS